MQAVKRSWTWEGVVAHWSAPLRRIVAKLIALIGVDDDHEVATVSRYVYRAIMRLLVPAESAARRLILMAAHEGLHAWRDAKPAQLPARRPVQASQAEQANDADAGSSSAEAPKRKVPSFVLFDPLPKLIAYAPFPEGGIVSFEDSGRRNEPVSAKQLGLRLLAIRNALDNLPKEAARLIRWWKRRDRENCRPRRHWPLKGGYPPGCDPRRRERDMKEVDTILNECASFANTLRRDLERPPP